MQEWLVLYQKHSMQEWLVLYQKYSMQQWLVAGRHLYQTATSINVQECPQQELSSLWVMPLSKTRAGVATDTVDQTATSRR